MDIHLFIPLPIIMQRYRGFPSHRNQISKERTSQAFVELIATNDIRKLKEEISSG
jgi:hypothetical protein